MRARGLKFKSIAPGSGLSQPGFRPMHAISPDGLSELGIGGDQQTESKGLYTVTEFQSRLVSVLGPKMAVNDAGSTR